MRKIKTFTYDGERLPFFDHRYNATITNERAIEISVALRWLERQDGSGLEIGNVLDHYDVRGHRVIDRYEPGVRVYAQDVFDIDGGPYDWVVSISTLEHVRWDEWPRNPYGGIAALLFLMGLVRPGGDMLVTLPFGQNPTLDRVLKSGFGVDLGWRTTVLKAPGKHAKPVWIGEWTAS